MRIPVYVSAALLATTFSAAAQTSVTVYGRVDLSVGKAIGSKDKYVADGSSSRLGFRGEEDLGGGLKALFHFEHRFEADTGTVGNGIAGRSQPGPRFWYGRSVVGLQGPFGEVVFGRDYTPSFQLVRVKGTPFGYDYVVSGNGVPAILGLGIGATRNDSAVTYEGSFSGWTVGAQIAEGTDSLERFQHKPMSVAVNYTGGPLFAGAAYEMPGDEAAERAKILQLIAAWDFKVVRVTGSYITGTTAAGQDRTGWMAAASAPLGNGEFRAAIGERKVGDADVTDTRIVALGYFHRLSKRTGLYADYIHNSKFALEKTGYDLGIRHNF